MSAYLIDIAEPAGSLGAPRHRHRLDRRVLLLRLARQSSGCAHGRRADPARVSPANCGRCTAAASTTRRNTASRRRPCRSPLHWFYWEAYSTLLSGFFLLGLLYYAQAEVYLIDPRVAALSKPAAIGIGLAFIIGGWLVYDVLCRSPLARSGAWLGCLIALAVERRGLRALPPVQRARRLHRIRRDARHDHGGECVVRHHSRPARDGSCQTRRTRAGPGARAARQAALGAQHLLHVAGAVHHDQQPLCDDLRRAPQLAGADRHVGGRRVDPRILRRAA